MSGASQTRMSFQNLFVPNGHSSSDVPTSAMQGMTISPSNADHHKASIGYILGNFAQEFENKFAPLKLEIPSPSMQIMIPSSNVSSPDSLSLNSLPMDMAIEAINKRKKKRKARICTQPGCEKYVVDHGLCIRHGGGKRCDVEGCDCRAQNRGLCWKHGGYTICKIEGCNKRAKSRGICWSHGGGTRCKFEGCVKIAVSLGRCWAHGGGKRCLIEGCRKPASERTDNLCSEHYYYKSN